ncbi:signal transducer and activator of transcription 5B [Venturia canescens]|uniref:signal transducer and activator of transcription 5B n=1 Tax=Venturia canescens TaxID=32260 RepID=UPI001C9D64BC|nr:signal transducer and activator of transcription 5B [Venturia canescens]XP_043290169.1 signal transducer and activator of transcription 5B [Venturia canescens]XP_043290170.1 signal transducer and activator of transcription 5B [Venturia canescens]XP_043290171.1 signal transducer and activator of transcription 5B [Venturia canescens]XP_043290172.1 signal transducer and activator of transcription 5B [Venturia canescens]XP_043290173.1 signal transducer and activator of transcription 5B [Venturi
MSLWAKAQQLPQEALQQVRSVYGEHFPIEVRHFLSSWIEEKMWTDIEPDNPQYEQYIMNLVLALIQELETKAASLNTEDLFLTKLKLIEAAKTFRQRYSQNPGTLFRIIRHCLGTEMKLVAQVENLEGALMSMAHGRVGLMVGDAVAEIAQQVEALRRRTQETSEDLRKMAQEQEAFAISYHECTKLNAHLQHLATQQQSQQSQDAEKKIRRQKEQQEQLLNHKIASLMQLRLTLADKLKETIAQLNTLQSRVLDDELIRWKRDQQLAGNGAPFNSNLDSIQEWCESLAELIWLNRQQIKEAEHLKQKLAFDPHGVPDILPNLNLQITQLLSSLVTSTFIIEKQPPQVMKTNTRFTSTVRLLVGGKLNVHMTPPQVKVTIISETQANALLKSDKMAKRGEASGEILNNTGTMEYHQATRQLSVSFRNMQLKKIKRTEKKGTESVMDEKFSLFFQSQFNVGGGELVFQVWTLSLPVVVIVHGNQEPHAWATVTWDNAFAEPGRVPFAVPDKVPWSQVAEALNVKFRSATGRALVEDNLRFLAEKAFRAGCGGNACPSIAGGATGNSSVAAPNSVANNPAEQDYSNVLLSWAQFCKEPLPERNFTFWEWFYAVMKLTREHLKGPWMDGNILGFVRKRQAEEMLGTCAFGTFLMRFSDSELGGVTIAWVGDQTEVFMLQPFTSKDFTIRSLADRISDLQHLLYLYPDVSKDQAFSKYYTPFDERQPMSNNGYVKPLLVTHVPGWGGGSVGGQTPSHSSVVGIGRSSQGGQGGSYPATPSTMFQAHSPDPSVTRDTPSVASSYAPGLGQGTGVGRTNSDMDYVELMAQGELPSIDDNLNLDQFNTFPFSEFMQTYNTKPQ